MLFMIIFEYEPENRDTIFNKFIEKGAMLPEGVKEVGMWSSIGGGRVFSVYETNDAAALAKYGHEWNDLGIGELVPLMETRDYVELLKR